MVRGLLFDAAVKKTDKAWAKKPLSGTETAADFRK
jgi:hypothetical protein